MVIAVLSGRRRPVSVGTRKFCSHVIYLALHHEPVIWCSPASAVARGNFVRRRTALGYTILVSDFIVGVVRGGSSILTRTILTQCIIELLDCS